MLRGRFSRQFSLVPNEGESYEGRQWGWTLTLDDQPYLRITTGGTGPCWNIEALDLMPNDEDDREIIHICELDDLIAALEVLRESDVYKANVERWA